MLMMLSLCAGPPCFVLNDGSHDELLMTLSPWAWPPDGCCRTKVVFSCVLLFMTDARPGQADAHDALAVRRASAGYYRTKGVVFVFDDDSQDELMRMMREPWPGCPSQTPGHQANTSGCL